MEFKKHWTKTRELDDTAHEILTGHDLEAYKKATPKILDYEIPDTGLVPGMQVLDFGCGMGRALYHIKQRHPGWRVVGFDNQAMIERIKKVWPTLSTMPGVITTRHWNVVTDCRCFDQINAELVLQHMEEEVLRERLQQFVDLLSKSSFPWARLFLHTRRTFDDLKTPLMPIVQNYFEVVSYHDTTPEFVQGSGTYRDHFSLSLRPRNKST